MPIYFAPSWLVIALITTVLYGDVIAQNVSGVSSGASYALAFCFAVLLALSLLAHELGHTAVSVALGMPVRRVVIFLLGGVSEMTHEPRRPRDEYLVAIAGPLVSLFLACVGWALLPLTQPNSIPRVLVILLAGSNLVVMIFNLLPGLPLDGGRVLRAGVWRLSGDRLAGTRAAAWSGKGLAALVLISAVVLAQYDDTGGIFNINILLGALLAGFMWVGANQSLMAATLTSRLPMLRVGDLARPSLSVPADLPVAEALRRVWEAGRRALVIVDAYGHPTGLVSEQHVKSMPTGRRPWTAVSEVSRPLAPELTLPDTLTGQAVIDALRRMPATEYLVVGVDGHTVGVLAMSDVAHLLQRGQPPASAR